MVMKNMQALLAVVAACVAFCAAGGPFEDRWVYVSRNLSKPEHVQEVADIVKNREVRGPERHALRLRRGALAHVAGGPQGAPRGDQARLRR